MLQTLWTSCCYVHLTRTSADVSQTWQQSSEKKTKSLNSIRGALVALVFLNTCLLSLLQDSTLSSFSSEELEVVIFFLLNSFKHSSPWTPWSCQHGSSLLPFTTPLSSVLPLFALSLYFSSPLLSGEYLPVHGPHWSISYDHPAGKPGCGAQKPDSNRCDFVSWSPADSGSHRVRTSHGH